MIQSSQNSTYMKAKGFTLIELLVTIAIIGVLAMLVLPAMKKTRDQAMITGCASNLRNIGVGMMMYAQENSNNFPASWGPANGNMGWPACLYTNEYVKDKEVFHCPGDKTHAKGADGLSYTYCVPVMTPVTLTAGGGGYYDPEKSLNLLNVQARSKQYLLTEWHNSGSTWNGGMCLNAGSELSDIPGQLSPSHNGDRNFLFADGHVERRPYKIYKLWYTGWVLNSIISVD